MNTCFATALRRLFGALAVAGVICTFTAAPLRADEGSDPGNSGLDSEARLVLGLGQFNIMNTGGSPFPDDNHSSVLVRGEYRSNHWLYQDMADKWGWGIAPQFGLLLNGDSGFLGYAGLYADFAYECGFFFSPALNIGLYTRGDGRDLGGPLEFEEELTAGYEFDNRGRVGVTFSHISNADIYDANPGVETLMLTYSVPLGGGLKALVKKSGDPAMSGRGMDTQSGAETETVADVVLTPQQTGRPAPEAADFARLAVMDKPAVPAMQTLGMQDKVLENAVKLALVLKPESANQSADLNLARLSMADKPAGTPDNP